MANFNKVILIGNLTRDPQLRYLPSQTPVCELGLAVNRRWRGQDGQQREETCFIDCTAFGKQAETLNQYMSKGRPILIEGRLQLDTWEGKDGTRRSKHRVVVENFQFLPAGSRTETGAPQGAGRDTTSRGQVPAAQDDASGPPEPQYDESGGDEIPF